jgi:hypothetical protein
MAEATTSAESGYQEIFKAFVVGASKVEARYYSLKELYKDIPSLARLSSVSQESFQALLVVSGLSSPQKNGQFIFSKNKVDSFLNMHQLQDKFELVHRQPKGFGNQYWFVKVGTQLWNNAATPGT